MENKLERITFFAPAFDKRSEIPSKNYGIGAMRCYMLLKGEKGVTHFIFSTGMYLEKTMTEYIKDGRATPEIASYGHYYLNKPMGFDVGYHSLTPIYDGQDSRDNCEWLDGKPCYGDGSVMRAEEYLNILLEKGSDEIWKMLEEEYNVVFKK